MPAPDQETNQRTMTLKLQHNLWAPLEVQEERRSAGRVRIQSQPVAKSAIEFQQFEREKLVPTVFRTHSGPAILQSNLHTLPSRDSAAYRFRNTIAYWVAVFFAEGSLLFVVGASSSMVVESEWRRLGLIEYSYFAGSIFFTLGAYMGFFEVINVGRHAEGSGLRFFSLSGTSVEGYWGTFLYLVGALLFNIACVYGLLPRSFKRNASCFWAMYYAPSTAGSACFTAAALIEFKHNAHVACSTPVFWLCFFYLAGSVLFLMASAASVPNAEEFVDELVNMPYLLGSIAFALGAWVSLWMWKAEQFGLGFIREINEPHVGDKPSGQGIGAFTSPYELQGDDNFNPRLLHPDHKTLKEDQSLLVSEMGHASAVAVDVKQQVFLLVYVSLGTLSIVDVCAAVANLVEAEASDGDDFHPLLFTDTLLSSVTDCVTAHAVLLVVSVVHRVPSLHPYGFLLWLMRWITLLYLTCNSVRFCAFFTAYEA